MPGARKTTSRGREAAGRAGSGRPAAGGPGTLLIAAALATMLAAAGGCDPDSGFEVIKDYDNVLTLRDGRFNFTALETYAVPDSVVDLVQPGDPVADNITSVYNEYILELVRERLESFGYIEVEPDLEDPDLFVLVSVTNQVWLEFPYRYHWWDNWSWYGDWPGWNDQSRGAYPPEYRLNEFVFPNGTLFIDILDARDPYADLRLIPVRWTAVLNGVLTNTSAGTTGRLHRNINAAFDQSPYLGAGGTPMEGDVR